MKGLGDKLNSCKLIDAVNILYAKWKVISIYLIIVWLWELIKDVKQTSVLLGHGPNKIFLVPNSCRATERNGDSVSADVTDDTIENN